MKRLALALVLLASVAHAEPLLCGQGFEWIGSGMYFTPNGSCGRGLTSATYGTNVFSLLDYSGVSEVVAIMSGEYVTASGTPRIVIAYLRDPARIGFGHIKAEGPTIYLPMVVDAETGAWLGPLVCALNIWRWACHAN